MKRPALMGIVNVTPDSFSGDGVNADKAIALAEQLVKDGADIIDIGAESTRPGATPLADEEEWARLAPVLSGIMEAPGRRRVRLSVDTRHALTASRALDLGVEIINDVSGLADHAMAQLLAGHAGDVVVMHALSIPAVTSQTLPAECDVVDELLAWKTNITTQALAHGIAAERLIYDVGIGFGKTPKQSLELMLAAAQFQQSGGRWLFGHSRKSFLKLFTNADASMRDDLTLAFSAQLAQADVDFIRVHNVARHAALFEQLCT
jgi:dihydropteroate synthase